MDGEVRFAEVGPARVGFAVHGRGDLDIVYAPGFATHLDLTLEQPRYRRFIECLSRYGRVIRFDRRGAGVSDPPPPGADEDWEIWADDLAAVLAAVGTRQAAIIATNDAGPAAILFAATHPELVKGLVLVNTPARFTAAEDYPEGHPAGAGEMVAQAIRDTWGREDSVALLAPSLAADQPFRRWYSRFQRAACTPAAMAGNMARLFRMDGRAALAEVRCPTLVLHREDYGTVPPAHGRHLAENIPGAVFELVAGQDAPIYTQGMKPLVDRIGAFLGRAAAVPDDPRLFSTVLFTDIVDSTRMAVELGDRGWNALIEAHDAVGRDAVAQAGGLLIKTTGDGLLARFDAPSRALGCALEMHRGVQELGVRIRAGLHAGQVTLRDDGDVSGVAVNIAARVLGEAGTGETLVTSSVVDLLTGPDHRFCDRGERGLKGLPDPQRLFAVGSR